MVPVVGMLVDLAQRGPEEVDLEGAQGIWSEPREAPGREEGEDDLRGVVVVLLVQVVRDLVLS